jgi:hypothetical protein
VTSWLSTRLVFASETHVIGIKAAADAVLEDFAALVVVAAVTVVEMRVISLYVATSGG